MRKRGLFENTYEEVGEIIVADVDQAVVKALVDAESAERERLITTA